MKEADNMADINAYLREAINGPAPQHKVAGRNQFEISEGSDGATHTKIVDVDGNPLSSVPVEDKAVKAELAEIRRAQADILERLDDGIDTRLTGSNVEELQSYVDDDTFNTLSASRWRYFSNRITDAPISLSPVDVSVFNKKAIYFENNTNHNIVNIEIYGTSAAGGPVNREDVRLFSFGVADLEEGESVFITEEECPELKHPCIGLAMRTSLEAGFNTEDSEGTVTVRFYGYGK